MLSDLIDAPGIFLGRIHVQDRNMLPLKLSALVAEHGVLRGVRIEDETTFIRDDYAIGKAVQDMSCKVRGTGRQL